MEISIGLFLIWSLALVSTQIREVGLFAPMMICVALASSYFGGIVGRVANRIRDGKFTLGGSSYQLAQNNGGNALHGTGPPLPPPPPLDHLLCSLAFHLLCVYYILLMCKWIDVEACSHMWCEIYVGIYTHIYTYM